MKKIMLLLVWLIALNSCSPEPKPIEYGVDSCDFCMMSIVDPQHAAELVSTKGKVYKYDAIECMVNNLSTKDINDFAFFLVNDFKNPGVLIDANTSHYLISENLPSPMGANLTAFANMETASDLLAAKGGTIYSWAQIQNIIPTNKKYSEK